MAGNMGANLLVKHTVEGEGMFGMLVGGFSGQVITLLLPRHVSRCVEHLNV